MSKNNILDDKEKQILLNEISYNQFKKEASQSSHSSKMAKAVRSIHKRLNEISKIVSYTEKMKTELMESGDIKVWKSTQNSMIKINEEISSLKARLKKMI